MTPAQETIINIFIGYKKLLCHHAKSKSEAFVTLCVKSDCYQTITAWFYSSRQKDEIQYCACTNYSWRLKLECFIWHVDKLYSVEIAQVVSWLLQNRLHVALVDSVDTCISHYECFIKL